MNPKISQLLAERRIVPVKRDRKIVLKEIHGADYDLDKARRSLEENDAKWATVKAYYAMFHAARALLLSAGYREKSHRALLISIRELYRDRMDSDHLRAFEEGMDLREEADYSMIYAEDTALELIDRAEAFLIAAKTILRML